MISVHESSAMTPLPNKRVVSRRKKWMFAGLTTLLVASVIETLSLAALFVAHDGFQWSILAERQEQIARGVATADESQESIHPYMGWSFNPQVSPGVTYAGRLIPVNSVGLVDDGPSIRKRDPQRLIVGISGGSVAWQMTVAGEAAFKGSLAQKLGRPQDEIQVVRLAMSGFKQPQQLMTLNWLMTQGAEFDVVVNLDGYNEAAGANTNRTARVCMGYPTNWHARTRDIVDPREYAYSFEVFQLRALRQRLAQDALTSWWRWSPTYNFIWHWREERIRDRRVELGTRLISGHQIVGIRGFVSAGPAETFADNTAADQLAVQVWANSSVQMASLCRGAGCRYLHVLQPNQYAPHSKPFSPEELAQYVKSDAEYAQVVQRLYPQFTQRGQALTASGVRFRDLTALFNQTSETVYADHWCHLNELGNRLLGEALGREVAALLSEDSAQ